MAIKSLMNGPNSTILPLPGLSCARPERPLIPLIRGLSPDKPPRAKRRVMLNCSNLWKVEQSQMPFQVTLLKGV